MLTGVVPNLLTPMTADGRPDVGAIERLVNFVIDKGVGGIWLLGSAGEDVHISMRDRITVAKTVAAFADGRIPVVAGLGQASWYDIMAFAEAVGDTGIEAFHYLPYDLKMDDATLQNYVVELSEHLPLPLWLYHNTKRGRPITLAMVRELRERPEIAGIKVGGYSLTELTRMLMLEQPGFQVSGAGGGQMYQMLSMGAKLHMTSDANCYPEVFVKMFELFAENRLDEALDHQHRLIELSASFPRNGNGEHAAEEKYILKLRGVIDEHVNLAYRTLTDDEKAKTRACLKEFGFEWA